MELIRTGFIDHLIQSTPSYPGKDAVYSNHEVEDVAPDLGDGEAGVGVRPQSLSISSIHLRSRLQVGRSVAHVNVVETLRVNRGSLFEVEPLGISGLL